MISVLVSNYNSQAGALESREWRGGKKVLSNFYVRPFIAPFIKFVFSFLFF